MSARNNVILEALQNLDFAGGSENIKSLNFEHVLESKLFYSLFINRFQGNEEDVNIQDLTEFIGNMGLNIIIFLIKYFNKKN